MTTGELGKVTSAAAPQLEFVAVVVVVTFEVSFFDGFCELERTHAATSVVPPTEPVKTTRPSNAITTRKNAITMRITKLFTMNLAPQ